MTGEEEGYIRGAGGVATDGRRVAVWILTVVAAILAALTIVFVLVAVHHNSRATSLKRRGAPVTVTVTSCVALASGTGITQAGFVCKGSYLFAGRHYIETIGGSSTQLTAGQQVPSVVVRDEPTVVYAASSAAKMHPTWTVYLTPAGLLVALAVLLLWLRAVIARR